MKNFSSLFVHSSCSRNASKVFNASNEIMEEVVKVIRMSWLFLVEYGDFSILESYFIV
jgi:hypothetical protein